MSLEKAPSYVMYVSMRLPIALNALFNPLASEFIPAVAANATKAIIRTYSTRRPVRFHPYAVALGN